VNAAVEPDPKDIEMAISIGRRAIQSRGPSMSVMGAYLAYAGPEIDAAKAGLEGALLLRDRATYNALIAKDARDGVHNGAWGAHASEMEAKFDRQYQESLALFQRWAGVVAHFGGAEGPAGS
jgi:hypothetical protein